MAALPGPHAELHDAEKEKSMFSDLEAEETRDGAPSTLQDPVVATMRKPPPPQLNRTRRLLHHLEFLLPSFLHRRVGPPRKLHPTAWLDGLRGIAALLVVVHHCSLVWFSWSIHDGWAPDGSQHAWLIRLPIIRFFIAGQPQVAIFFAISGYVISYKTLRLARQGRFADAGAALSSSFFRRHPRLFLPAAAVTLANALLVQLNVYGTPEIQGSAIAAHVPPHGATLGDQLVHYGWAELIYVRPILAGLAHGENMEINGGNPYDTVQWTLPIEFSSSIVVFGFLAAFTQVRNRLRMAFALALLVYVEYLFVFWAIFLFFGGMLICDLRFELDEMRARRSSSSSSSSSTTTLAAAAAPERSTLLPVWARSSPGRRGGRPLLGAATCSRLLLRTRGGVRVSGGRVVAVAALLAALWLLGMPEVERGAAGAWGYKALAAAFTPRFGDRLVVPAGALLLVLAVDHSALLQRLFTNRFAQYMGRISFSLYLCHGPLMFTLALTLGHRMTAVTGSDTNLRHGLGTALAACVWFPVTIWIADLATRLVDERCVRVTRWAYEKMLKKVD